MADIFISYKSEERALPEALASDLRAAGYSVWWDVDLVGGAAFRAQILEKLNAARAVIVIWTPASVQSEFVLDEADHAKQQGKLIPVRLPELDPRHIPLGHRQAQTCLLSERPRILGALQAMGLFPQTAPVPPPSPAAITADERLWQEVSAEKSLDAFLYYLRKFRNGAHASEADDLIWGILSAENMVASYRRYLELLPSGRHAIEADDLIWSSLSPENTIASYRCYLELLPEGLHGAVAEFRIERLEEKRKSDRAAELAQMAVPSLAPSKSERNETCQPDSNPLLILPVRETVLFPGVLFPISLGRPMSVAAVEQAMREERQIGILMQRDPETPEPSGNDMHRIGTVANIARHLTAPDGTHHVVVQGVERFRVLDFIGERSAMTANVQRIPEPEAEGTEIEARTVLLRQQAIELFELLLQVPAELVAAVQAALSPSTLTDLTAAYMDIPAEEKQEILETVDLKLRMDKVSRLLSQRIEVLRLSQEIGRQTKAVFDERQREAVLREQMAAIQHRLGEGDGG